MKGVFVEDNEIYGRRGQKERRDRFNSGSVPGDRKGILKMTIVSSAGVLTGIEVPNLFLFIIGTSHFTYSKFLKTYTVGVGCEGVNFTNA